MSVCQPISALDCELPKGRGCVLMAVEPQHPALAYLGLAQQVGVSSGICWIHDWVSECLKSTDAVLGTPWMICSQQKNAFPQIHPCPPPWSPWICYMTGGREWRLQMKLKLLICCFDSREIILDYLGGPNVITWDLKSGRGRQEGTRDTAAWGLGLTMSLALKMQQRAMCQGKQMVSRSWKKQGNGFSSRASNRNVALPTSCF